MNWPELKHSWKSHLGAVLGIILNWMSFYLGDYKVPNRVVIKEGAASKLRCQGWYKSDVLVLNYTRGRLEGCWSYDFLSKGSHGSQQLKQENKSVPGVPPLHHRD